MIPNFKLADYWNSLIDPTETKRAVIIAHASRMWPAIGRPDEREVRFYADLIGHDSIFY